MIYVITITRVGGGETKASKPTWEEILKYINANPDWIRLAIVKRFDI